jgi:transcriptional regulator with PAS, ATPase and Fis domain
MITYNQFHKGLYYILHVSDILIPPLRKRPEDISVLISTFLNHFSEKYHYTRYFSEAAMQIMLQADWNNNVRELKYVIERLFISSETIVIDVDQLPSLLFGISQSENTLLSADSEMGFDDRVAQYESLLIHDAYEKYGTSRNVASHLKISQTKANNLINKYIHK